jgi:hypothetical protein
VEISPFGETVRVKAARVGLETEKGRPFVFSGGFISVLDEELRKLTNQPLDELSGFVEFAFGDIYTPHGLPEMPLTKVEAQLAKSRQPAPAKSDAHKSIHPLKQQRRDKTRKRKRTKH